MNATAAPAAPAAGAGPVSDVKSVVLRRFGIGALVIAGGLFGAAGTLQYWQAWLYLAVLLVPLSFAAAYFLRRNPAFLERRMRLSEKRQTQRGVVVLTTPLVLGVLLVPALDQRFGWSTVPAWLCVLGSAAVLLSYGSLLYVFKVNAFASRVVEVESGQKVITTGPYAMVRHPMYAATIVMYAATSLALGSWWGLIPAVFLVPAFVVRLLDEERLLAKELPGYAAYQQQTRFRLVPGVW